MKHPRTTVLDLILPVAKQGAEKVQMGRVLFCLGVVWDPSCI